MFVYVFFLGKRYYFLIISILKHDAGTLVHINLLRHLYLKSKELQIFFEKFR